ncbi:MAG: hypothetical protein HYY22_06000 [Thaumarchaeota archaeon]|nr:hypothetical protein [Nitrososphaerota archaeon]
MYDRDETEASKSALIELGTALGTYRDDFVLAGGWAPFFLSTPHFDHCGSRDIDFVLRPSIMIRYNNIRKIIEGLGYTQTENIFRFKRDVPSSLSGKHYEIELDFLTEPQGAKVLPDEDLITVQKDLRACLIQGCSVAFTFNYRETINGIIPQSGETSINLKVANIVSSLVMKGKALENRLSEKDSYDIYAVAGFHMGGPERAAERFLSEIRNSKQKKLALIESSVQTIQEAFSSPRRRGPYEVARFMGTDSSRIDAFERVKRFVNIIERDFVR